MPRTLRLILLVALCILGTSCRKKAQPMPAAPPAKHEHVPPHGGTPVVLGQEIYHLEFVHDVDSERITAYILDGEMENFIRSSSLTFDVIADIGGEKKTLTFRAIASSATGETVGNSSMFEAAADWLKSARMFDGVLQKITIRGADYSQVAFNFPKGNDKD